MPRVKIKEDNMKKYSIPNVEIVCLSSIDIIQISGSIYENFIGDVAGSMPSTWIDKL